MATILQDEKRRCDASCYDAKHDHCDCICGGTNHRQGLAGALDNSANDERAVEAWVVYYQPKATGRVKLFCAQNDEQAAKETAAMLIALGAHNAWYEMHTAPDHEVAE